MMFLLLLIILFSVFYFYFWYKFQYWNRFGVEIIEKPILLFGNFWPFLTCSQTLAMQFYRFYTLTKNNLGGFYLFNKPALLIKDPELIKKILVTDFDNFCDRGLYCNEKTEPLSGHLFRLNGDRWRYIRSRLSPAFTLSKVKHMCNTIEGIGQHWDDYLEQFCDCNINFSQQSQSFMSDLIASVYFGLEVNTFKNPDNYFIKLVKSLLTISYIRYFLFILVSFLPKIVPYLRIPTVHKKTNLQTMKLVEEVIEYRDKNNIIRSDFLQVLTQARSNNDIKEENKLSVFEISMSVYTMLYAGLDTSANTIAFCFYELAKNPEIQNKVCEEIDQVLANHNDQITYNSVMKMTYLEQVVDETLRLYPSLAFIKRLTTKNYTDISLNLTIEKGVQILISVYGLHHDPKYFANPEKFDPDRFSSENKQNIHPFTYLPFGDGPRACIGKKVAMIATMSGIARVLRKRQIHFCEETPKEIKFERYMLPLEPEKPIILKITKRNAM